MSLNRATKRLRVGQVVELGALREVFDAIDDGVVIARADGRIVYANAALEVLLGWSADLIDAPLQVLMPDRMHAAHVAGFKRYVETRQPHIIGQPIRVPALHRDGHEVMIELLLSVIHRDGDFFVVATLRDPRLRLELERLMAQPTEASPSDLTACLVIGEGGSWFQPPLAAKVELSKRQRTFRRLVLALVEQRLKAPRISLSIRQMIGVGWPGERVSADAAANRVRVAVANLRRLGFAGLLLSNDDGYFIDPAVRVVFALPDTGG